jgi:hypothetical protein
MIEPESYAFIGNGLVLRSMKDDMISVEKDYFLLEK